MTTPGPQLVEEFVEAGLYEPGRDDGSGRLDLLRWLGEQGFTVAEMREGLDRDSLGSMAGDRRLVPGARMTRAAAVEASGLDPVTFDEVAVALQFQAIHGAPEGEIGFTAAEVASIARFGSLRGLFSPPEATSLLRTIGGSVARISDAAVSMFLADIESPHLLAGESELELALKIYDAIGVMDGFSQALDPLLRRQMLQAIERTRRTIVGETERFVYRYAVGFVDLVGFTSVSAEFGPTELAVFVRDFEAQAHDLAIRNGGRVVKLIGDEVMFVAEDATDACRVAGALMDELTAGDGRVLPRGGLAYGLVLPRGGDFYGTVVNLAARLVNEAVPKELLVTTEVAAAAAIDCDFEPAGRRMIKGFDQPVRVMSLARVGRDAD